MKIAVNRDYGVFGLSEEAYRFLGLAWDSYGFAYNDYDKRTDPDLIECIEALGSKANGKLARIEIVEVPDDLVWTIDDKDGYETVEEVHRSW